MNIFLEKFNLPRINQKEIEIMSNPITNNEITNVILKKKKKTSPKKAQGKMASQVNSTKYLEKS